MSWRDELTPAEAEEVARCRACQEGGFGPGHFASAVCRSNGRKRDKYGGHAGQRAHCSCDACY